MGETANMIISRSRISEIVVWVIVVAMPAAGAQSEEIRTAEDAARSADGQGKEFISSLVEIKDSPDECYDTLKRRLLEGHFDDVKAGLDLRDDQGRRIFEDYRFARLRALCARAIFRRYSYRIATSGRANEKQGARLRKLAKETTAAYEEAFRLAPSDFERACIYARWHEIHTYRHFEADSLLLRSGSPLEYQDKPVDEALSSQVMRLRSAAARILGSAAPYDKPMGADAKTAFLNVLIDEYRKLGRIGVPEEVFREVLNDLPVFLQRGLSPRVLFEPEVKRIMIRYHLWYALTGPRPDRIDNEFLDQQLQTVDRYIREGFTDKLSTEDTDVASAIFLECSGLVRSNCFLPRLKETLWPFEWSEPRYKGQENMEDRILKEIDETVTRLVKNQDRWVSRSRTFSENQKLIREWTDIALRSMSSSLMLQLTINQRLGHLRQPPSAILGGGSGGGVSGFWVYQTHRYNPVQPYPWKKSITALDSRTASTRQIPAVPGGHNMRCARKRSV